MSKVRIALIGQASNLVNAMVCDPTGEYDAQHYDLEPDDPANSRVLRQAAHLATLAVVHASNLDTLPESARAQRDSALAMLDHGISELRALARAWNVPR